MDDKSCDEALRFYLRAWRPGHLSLLSNAAIGALSGKADAAADPRAPRYQVLDKDTILLSLGTFDGRFKPALEAILKEHRAELESHPYWIIDVRDNNGGSDSTYAPLMPWLLDGEYAAYKVEWLATPANAQAQEAVCDLMGRSEECLKYQAPVVKALKGKPAGSWVMTASTSVEYTGPEQREAHPPARVAVLVDRSCGSSCEQFLIEARSSYRVKLLGRPSRGTLDYSNLRPYKLPSGKRTLMYATSRSLRLPAMAVDLGGVQPDILLPQAADAAARDAEVRRVQRWLAGGGLGPQ